MNTTPTKQDVLIVGAGPTGLVLALWLTRLGVPVRIVDRAPEPGTASRAVVVQARILEQYRQVGLAGAVVDGGLQVRGLNFWVKGDRRGRLALGEIGQKLSPFPYVLVYPQDAHEKFLVERLAALGVRVERPTELVGLELRSDHALAKLRRADGSVEVCEARFVAGCDGARSAVRSQIGVGFPGGTYSHLFYVADVEGTGPTLDGEAHVAMEDDSNFLVSFAFAPGRARLIGTVRDRAADTGAELGWEDVSRGPIERMHVDVRKVNWFSTYRVHHRVASAFRAGPVFLLGDAAHVHSPVGGQGMNTGIGDAINLSWKLASVLGGRAAPEILASYEEERLPFARRLVRTTDRLFELVTADGPIATRLRVGVAPRVLLGAFRAPALRRLLFMTVSQLLVRYRGSRLSEGRAGRVRGGDRLPWLAGVEPDNFAPLASLGWQTHVYGEPPAGLAEVCRPRAPLHAFSWGAAAEEAGFTRGAAYLVRPDGYVALATEGAGAAAGQAIERYFEARAIRPGEGGSIA